MTVHTEGLSKLALYFLKYFLSEGSLNSSWQLQAPSLYRKWDLKIDTCCCHTDRVWRPGWLCYCLRFKREIQKDSGDILTFQLQYNWNKKFRIKAANTKTQGWKFMSKCQPLNAAQALLVSAAFIFITGNCNINLTLVSYSMLVKCWE